MHKIDVGTFIHYSFLFFSLVTIACETMSGAIKRVFNGLRLNILLYIICFDYSHFLKMEDNQLHIEISTSVCITYVDLRSWCLSTKQYSCQCIINAFFKYDQRLILYSSLQFVYNEYRWKEWQRSITYLLSKLISHNGHLFKFQSIEERNFNVY